MIGAKGYRREDLEAVWKAYAIQSHEAAPVEFALMNPLPIADEPLSPDEASQPGFLTHCERIMAKVARKIIGLISPIYPLQNQIATVTWST